MKVSYSPLFIILFVGCTLLKAVISDMVLFFIVCAVLSGYSLILLYCLDEMDQEMNKREVEDLFHESS